MDVSYFPNTYYFFSKSIFPSLKFLQMLGDSGSLQNFLEAPLVIYPPAANSTLLKI